MPWKKNADGALAIVDDKPVWVNDAGEEKPFDYAAFSKRLADTTKESVERKEKLRTLEARYARFTSSQFCPMGLYFISYASCLHVFNFMKSLPNFLWGIFLFSWCKREA